MDSIYKKVFTITNNQLDKNDHLTIGSILDISQEISGNHADSLNVGFDDLQKRKLFWVVVRNHIEVCGNLNVGKALEVETYPLKRRFIEFPREVKIYDNGELVAVCNTTWVVLSLEKFELQNEDLIEENLCLTPSYFDQKFKKLPRKDKGELKFVKTEEVTYSMLDHNDHMNNAKYLIWYQDIFEEERDPKSFQIEYLKQSMFHEKIDLYVSEGENEKELYGFSGDELKFYCKGIYEN